MLKATARGEGNKTLVEDPNAKPCCCPRKVSKLGLLWPCWEGAGAAAATCTPGTPMSLRCTLTSAHVFRGTRHGGTHVTVCAFSHSHKPRAEHTQHRSLVVLVPALSCHSRVPALARLCAGAFGKFSCLQTAAFVGFSPFIAMETVMKLLWLLSQSHLLWWHSQCHPGLAGGSMVTGAECPPGRDVPVLPALPAAARLAWLICLSGNLFIQLPPLHPSGSPYGKQTANWPNFLS